MILPLILIGLALQTCRDTEVPRDGKGCTNNLAENYDPAATVDDGSCFQTECVKCTAVIPENVSVIDGNVQGFKPGDIICLDAAKNYNVPMRFVNINGTAENPIVITNCGGTATLSIPKEAPYAVKFLNSEHFRVTGVGGTGGYGLWVSGGNISLAMDYRSTNFEIDHVEISDSGFAGIMAKTDPSCDTTTYRGKFTLRDASFHHNFVHDTGGEGFYIGNSFYSNGVETACGQRYPHELENIKVYNNYIKNSGWEAIQVGCVVAGAEIYGNIIENYGAANREFQNNGIQIGEGTGGRCYNNYLNSGNGNGIIVLGLGDNLVFNNIIVNAGIYGIFCDDRFTTGDGFAFINNTIINPGKDGIRLYADQVKLNSVINNLIVAPGSFDEYEYDDTSRKGEDAFLFLLNGNVPVNNVSNFFTRDPGMAGFDQPGRIDFKGFETFRTYDFRIKKPRPIIDTGQDVSSYGITFDFFMNPRPMGGGFDKGAIEYNR